MQITIVGLGIVGQSIGLALKQVAPEIRIVGHDADAAQVKSARSLGAIDSSHWNLVSACDGADIILLDIPFAELAMTLDAIGPDLGAEAVVSDLIPIKSEVMAIAREHLAQPARFCGGHLVSPALLNLQGPSADWLSSATYFMVAPPSLSAQAMDKMANLADALGCKPQFTSAEEHDGLVAAMQQLPELAGAAILDTLVASAGARDRANAVGLALSAHATALERGAPDPEQEWLANRTNLSRWLDLYIQRLTVARDALLDKDIDTLQAMATSADHAAKDWFDAEPQGNDVESPSLSPWRSMFLGGLRFKRDHKPEKR